MGDNHDKERVRKERDNNVKCANCGGNHPANYKGYEIYKSRQKEPFPQVRTNVSHHKQTV